MKSLFSSFALLALAACSGPSESAVRAGGEGVVIERPGGATASRAIEAPSQSASGPLVADYLLVDKSDRLLIAYRAGEPIRAYRNIQFGEQGANVREAGVGILDQQGIGAFVDTYRTTWRQNSVIR